MLRAQSPVRGVGNMILVVVSTGHFDPLIESCARLCNKFDFLAQIGSGTFIPPFPHFRIAEPPLIESLMSDAELVVSHGGAGMTAMLNRLKKKNVIVPKQRRYGEANNLQVELAEKWAELGMTELCMDVGDLEKAIESCRKKTYHFPQFPKLGEHLRRILGYPESLPEPQTKVGGY